MVGEKVVLRSMMRACDGHYVGGLVNGAKIMDFFGDVGTELMVRVDGDISLFLGYKDVVFTAPVYVGDFMEYHGWIEKVGNCSYACKFEAYKVITMANEEGLAGTAANCLIPPVLCGKASGSLYISKECQRGEQDPKFVHEHTVK